ncbi:hypothetical protein [Metakosakonia massiliensis]|uniref:Lipoprotein n=1 Tax=Phytobacter massiliensis TaxID=1485952 RepID=A0A6N3CJK2_9ENTR
MRLSSSGFARTLVTASLCLSLTGCMSYTLLTAKSPRTTKDKWKTDTIRGMSLAQDSNGTRGYVFIGQEFDYLLTAGGDNVVKILTDPLIDRHELQVAKEARFVLSGNRKKFSGELELSYRWTTPEQKQAAEGYGFNCESKICSYKVSSLQGTIHKKGDNESSMQMLAFYHPFTVGFYEYHSHIGLSDGVKTVLLPVTLTLDLVTAPLQFIAVQMIYRQ